jgi:hypothetical protein
MDVAPAMEFDLMIRALTILLAMTVCATAGAELQVVIIEGLGGEPRYAERFSEQVVGIETAVSTMTTSDRVAVFRNGAFTRETLLGFFDELGSRMNRDDRLAVFMIGHGSFDDHQYKFNIAGPDVTDEDLKTVLDAIPATAQLLVNSGSSSGAVQEKLQGGGRTLMLATRSGVERHATRFGDYLAGALSDSSADVDKNNIVSAAEAFQFAERQVADYYERNGQLATEHPRLDGDSDNAARFGLARLGVAKRSTDDTALRRLQTDRDELNSGIDDLRLRRDSMTSDAYQEALLQNMLELATLEEQIELREAELDQ